MRCWWWRSARTVLNLSTRYHMSDAVIIAAIGSVQVVLLAYIAQMARRTEKNTNSMREQLVAKTEIASHAEGMADQREKTKAKGNVP